jgi:ubiquitin carboxyl-terminal hydrolase 25/28
VSDFTDNLVLWAYNRQRNCDTESAPYYLECLSGLAAGRKSEALQVGVATLRSQGEFSRSDILEAYKALNIDFRNRDEDLIIGVFKSRLIDAPIHEASMREQLGIIGKALKSPKIQQVAQKGRARPVFVRS